MIFLCGLLASLFGVHCRTPRGAAPEPPGGGKLLSLVIYYGWPSVAGGARGTEDAAARLGVHDLVVLGAGLERPEHADHAATCAIVARLRGTATELHGYIPLGSATGLDREAILAAVARWRELGVHGIFFDEAGHDFGTTRARQNLALEAAHRAGLRAFVNAFDPDDLFTGAPEARFRAGDSYLYESFGVRLGEPEPESERSAKLAKLEAARRRGVRLLGVTTSRALTDLSGDRWSAVITLAREARLDGVGWGMPGFGASDGRLPPSARPGGSP
jgi:hypothetical protein